MCPFSSLFSSGAVVGLMLSDVLLTLQISADVNDGVIHLDPADMRLLGVMVGDLIAAEGGRRAYLEVCAAFLGDRNQRLARVSPLTAANLGAFGGQKIHILPERVKLPLAERVVLETSDDVDRLHLIARQRHLADHCMKRAVSVGDEILIPTLDRFPLRARVAHVAPAGAARVGLASAFVVASLAAGSLGGDAPPPPLGGLREAYKICRRIMPARFVGSNKGGEGGPPVRSILLSGAEGVGKAHLVHRLAQECGVFLQVIDVYKLMERKASRGSVDLEDWLSDLARRGPSFLILDRLEALSEEGGALSSAAESFLTQLEELFDALPMHASIVVFGVLAGEVPQKNRLISRFDFALHVDRPNMWGRREVLHVATENMALADDVDLDDLAVHAFGMTARDLCVMARAAACLAGSGKVGMADFMAAYRSFNPRPLAPVGALCDIPQTSWEDVAGLDDIKQLLNETLAWSINGQTPFINAGINPPRSILLSGGQGTGKTSLVRGLAAHKPMNYIEVSCPAMMAQHGDASARFVSACFALARRKAPCLLFFDDIDALFEMASGQLEEAPHRNPLIAQLMVDLDTLSPLAGVVVVAATNRPDRLTAEVLRVGRLDFAVTFPMPDAAARRKIFQIHTRKLPIASDVDFERLAASTQSFSPADIAALCNRVGLLALRQSMGVGGERDAVIVVTSEHFEQALRGRKG